MLQGALLVCHSRFLVHDFNLFAFQTAALSMQEQERFANEEAEKRLKAALTAKREPAIASRMASPSVGVSNTVEPLANPNHDTSPDAPPSVQETGMQEDVAMETEANPTAVLPPSTEVRSYSPSKSKL